VSHLISIGETEGARRFACIAVLDVDAGGNLLGLEILQASGVFGGSIPGAKAGSMSIQFDPRADALYVHLQEGRSAAREVRDTIFYVAQDDELVHEPSGM
jgi:uncharacterized protein YuzE